MADLAIKGHPTRGEEVIEILEMLGGKSNGNIKGYNDDLYYYIAKDGLIYGSGIKYEEFACNYTIFTLEEFLEKYPYKVGDKVIAYAEYCIAQFTIQDMRWNYELNKVEYKICSTWCDTSLMQPYKEETMEKDTNKAIFEGNTQSCDIMNDIIKEETMEDKDIIEQTTEINLNHPCFDGHNKIELIIPENWKFEHRGNKMFGVRKYPQYPKTYGECCDILGYDPCEDEINCYKGGFIESFVRLLICRDAYWKIAGEQMGLGKPWEPDWDNLSTNHEFIKINKGCFTYSSRVLVFPTAEMRDTFYDNFKYLIERCKELL